MTQSISLIGADIAELTRRAGESVVFLDSGRGHGAGTIWDRNGLLITNAHVLGRRAPQVILCDGRAFDSRVLACDQQADIAALAIEATNLPAIPLGNSSLLRAGEFVIALGHPWGVRGAASAGSIIAVGRLMEGHRQADDLIQTSIWLRPGHSGGPLIDSSGRLVGINSMIAGPHVGLAIPLPRVKEFLRHRFPSY